MPKLPTFQNLSNVTPKAAGPSSISPGAASGIAAAYSSIGDGIKSGLDGLAGALKANEKERDTEDTIRAHTGYQAEMNDLNRRYQTDNDYETYDERFKAEEEAIRRKYADGIRNEKVRKEWYAQKGENRERWRAPLLDRGLRLKKEKYRATLNSELDQQVGIATQPDASPADVLMNIIGARSTITAGENAGWLTPGEALEVQRETERRIYLQREKNRVATDAPTLKEEIEVYKRDLAKGKAGRMGRSGEAYQIKPYDGTRTTGRPRSKPVRGVIAHYTEGGTTMEGLASWANQSNTGYNYYIDRQGNVIEFAGDDVVMNHAGEGRRKPGDKAPHLGNGNTIGIGIMTPKGGKATPEQIEAFRILTGRLSAKHGFSAKSIFGHGEVAIGHRKSTEAMDVVGAVREQGFAGTSGEAGPAGPRDGEQPKDDVTPQEAGDMPPQEVQRREDIARRFDAMKPEDLIALEAAADREISRQAAKNAGMQEAKYKDHIEQIRITGGGREDFNLDDFPKEIRPQLRSQIARAEEYHAATKDVATMSRDDMEKARQKLLKARREFEGKPEWNDYTDMIRRVQDAHQKRLKMRETDPAESVADTKKVRAAQEVYDDIAAEAPLTEDKVDDAQAQYMRRKLAEARIEAQEEAGIPRGYQRRITKQEAEELLQYKTGQGSEEEFDALIKGAYNEALKRYGDPDMAARVVADAYAIQAPNTDKDRAGAVGHFLKKFLRDGTTPTRKQTEQMGRVQDQADRASIKREADAGPQYPRPNQTAVDLLKKHAGDTDFVRDFKAQYGDEVAIAILSGTYDPKAFEDATKKVEKDEGNGWSWLFGSQSAQEYSDKLDKTYRGTER